MNELANIVNDFINNNGIKYQFIADKIGMSKQGLYQLMRKKQFGIDEANKILNAIGGQVEINIAPKTEQI